MFRQEVGGTMAGEAAGGADRLDLEAAEQLIQLSGGDDGGSESRSADSVKFRGADHQAGMKGKEKDVVVESRRRRRFVAGKDGDGGEARAGEPGRRSASSVNNKRSKAAGTGEKGNEEEPAVESRIGRSATRVRTGKDSAGVIDDDGERRRRRPRFRWLADIYRETRQLTTRDPRAAGGSVPLEGDRRRKRERAADADEVVVPMVSEGSKARTVVA